VIGCLTVGSCTKELRDDEGSGDEIYVAISSHLL
jgi:putative component of toxin-antitoxin plasmid stabilization module